MPNLSIYIPFNRSRGLLLRLVAVLISTKRRASIPRGRAQLPAHLRKDVGLLPEPEHPPPILHRFPF